MNIFKIPTVIISERPAEATFGGPRRHENPRLPAIAAGVCMLLALGLPVGCSQQHANDVDFVSALEHLSTVPVAAGTRPAAVSGMLSSYDRTGGNRDWANWRELWIADNDYLLADLRGPGCLRRIWITNVRGEEWLFYFDNESRPRLRIPEAKLFGGNGGFFPFEPPLADGMSGGATSYVPLPYRTRLRVVVRNPHVEPGTRPYFQINYETYPSGVRVASYPRRLGRRERDAVRRTQTVWNANAATMAATAARLTWQPAVVPAGGSLAVFKAADQAGVLETLGIRLDLPATLDAVQRARALRHLVLRAHWDEASAPSIETPLGDFFCNGLHARRFTSLTLANVDGVYICRFPMPFRRAARLTLHNDGPFPIPLASAVEWTTAAPEHSRYFHASWRSAESPERPFRIFKTEGRGFFLGTYLIALGMQPDWNILEGDEYFYRDGHWAPVQHGTGLEDYFNGGWYYFGLFEQPLYGLTEKAAMRTAQYRLQIPDPVSFESSLEMQIEFGDGNNSRGYKSATAYWYQDHPGPAGSELPGVDQRFPPLEPIGTAAIMSELFELERMGLDLEAEERCAYYAMLFDGNPLGEIFNLRALAYREIREGPAAVRDAYRSLSEAETTFPDVARQAGLLLWRTQAPYRALFGGSGYADFQLFVNGLPIGSGGDPFTYTAFPVQLASGVHRLQAEVRSRGEHSWYTFGFFSDFTNVVSDISWDYSIVRPEGWPQQTGDEALWKPYAVTPWFFPTMQWWRFTPNAFPAVQSGRQAGGPFAGWEQPAGRSLYLRRRIDVPDTPEQRVSPFTRRITMRGVPVRPADDTSNQDLDTR